MSADELDPEGLRVAFAAQLQHLADYKGLRYVPGGPSLPDIEPRRARPGRSEDQASQTPRRDDATQWSSAKKLHYLQTQAVGDCTRCPLHRTRTQLVFGVGNPEADIVFVGEAPGRDEDRQGEPFVGAAGQRLNRWIAALGMSRDAVYIANVLKCRPPNNRDPHPKEVQTCSPFLHAQLRAISPKVIVALGRFAGNLLSGRNAKMYEMRGRVHAFRDPKTQQTTPVVVTYHPSYVLRREGEAARSHGGANDQSDRKAEDQKVLDDLEQAKRLVIGD